MADSAQAVPGDILTIDGKQFRIGHGKHEPPKPTDPIICGCVEEVKGYLAGETWSDHPQCECPVIAAFMRPFSDRLPDDVTRAKTFGAYIAEKKCTRSTRAIEKRRGYMAADWSVRVRSPKLLRLCGHVEQAARLEALSEIVDVATAVEARTVARAIRSELWAKRDAFWIDWREKYDAAEAEAAAEEAEAAEAAAAAEAARMIFAPETWSAAAEAAKKVRISGQSWSSQKAAARSIFDAALSEAGTDRSAFVALRLEMRASAMDLVARMIALGEAA